MIVFKDNFQVVSPESSFDDSLRSWKLLVRQAKKIAGKNLSNECSNHSIYNVNFDELFIPIKLAKKPSDFSASSAIIDGGRDFTAFLNDFKRILVVGEAGMGKTCHFQKVFSDWAVNDDILSNFLVFKIDLSEVKASDCLQDIIFTQNFQKEKLDLKKDFIKLIVSDEYLAENKKILFLIDGIDDSKNINLFLSKLVSKASWPKNYYLIAWSKIWITKKLQTDFNLYFELIGYDDELKGIFFNKFFRNLEKIRKQDEIVVDKQLQEETVESKRFLSFLRNCRRDLLTACSNPLIAIITAIIWEEEKDDMKFKDNLIFEKFIKVLLERKSIYKETKFYTDIINHVSEKAYLKFFFNKPITETKIIKKSFYFGGILRKQSKYNSNKKIPLEFINNSLLEFLTAKYIVETLSNDDRRNIKNLNDVIAAICHEDINFKYKRMFHFMFHLSHEVYLQLLKMNPKIRVFYDSFPIDYLNTKSLNINKSTVDIQGLKITPYLWKSIIENIPRNVTRINLSNVKIDERDCFRSLIDQFSDTLENLTLDSMLEMRISVEIIELILEKFKKLKILKFNEIFFMQNELKIKSTSLIKLQIRKCCFNVEKLQSFQCPELKKLNLSYNGFFGKLIKLIFFSSHKILFNF